MPARKTLDQHVRHRTFRARRHHERLATEPLVPWESLAGLQRAYQAEPTELKRRKIAVEFQRLVRQAQIDDAAQSSGALPTLAEIEHGMEQAMRDLDRKMEQGPTMDDLLADLDERQRGQASTLDDDLDTR